MYKEDQAAQR